jgi:hypothetical protein
VNNKEKNIKATGGKQIEERRRSRETTSREGGSDGASESEKGRRSRAAKVTRVEQVKEKKPTDVRR